MNSTCPLQITQPAQLLITIKKNKALPLVILSNTQDNTHVLISLLFATAPKVSKLYDYGPLTIALTQEVAELLMGSTLHTKDGEFLRIMAYLVMLNYEEFLIYKIVTLWRGRRANQ